MDNENKKRFIFVSVPNPHRTEQKKFVKMVHDILINDKFQPVTLGHTNFSQKPPLEAIQELLKKCSGLITIASRRSIILHGEEKPEANVYGQQSKELSNIWLTSPFCHIETAMAFQIKIPTLLLKEKDVISDGVFERGIIGQYIPEFNLENAFMEDFLNSAQWKQVYIEWKKEVDSHLPQNEENIGEPLFESIN
ncbi:MAG: hypothetical protein FWG10_04280 [Eubacteriaceae bacterium]|nr:hypothetical protein [Eubacteriaceae bacterium]